MMPDIKVITLALPYHLGLVNCYLIRLETGYILIDTGSSNQRTVLETALFNEGCQPGNLKLIVLTHGDFDHTGNAAYLRQKFDVKVAMHPADFDMIEHGDMFASRSKHTPVLKAIAPAMFKFGQANHLRPDLSITDGDELSAYGFDACILALPGHSGGSIGILTADGDLFVGDLLENTKRPALNSIMDDRAAAQTSVERLKGLTIRLIYPGHGRPFMLDQFLNASHT